MKLTSRQLSALFEDENRGRWLVVHKSGEVIQAASDLRSLRAYLDAESTEHLILRIPRKEETTVHVLPPEPADEVKA